MKRLLLVIAAFAAAPALAQTGTDWNRPVTGVDAPAAQQPEIVIANMDLVTTGPAPRIGLEPVAFETPMPPPCEPPVSRATSQPGPPRPPAPCSPVK